MRVVCVDDEESSLQYLQRQLKKIHQADILATFTNPIEGKQFILEKDVDVVFLDIQMPQVSGIELAMQILREKPGIMIVFVTNYDVFTVDADALKLNAMDYLVKPVRFKRLHVTMKRIEKEMMAKKQDVVESLDVLRLKLIPSLAFEVEPNLYKPLQWRTTKTRELFLYLLQNSDVLVQKSSIIDLLWKEYDLEKAYALLYTTIYNIRKHLKPYCDHMVLHNQSDGYLLELNQVEIDIIKWETELAKLPGVNRSTVPTYEKVMAWNQGTYLSNYDYVWLEGERRRFDRLWVYTANQLAYYYTEERKLAKAIKWCNNIIERFPVIEEVHFNLMKLYVENGDFTLMMQQYNELNKVLRKELEGKPSEYIVEWYVSKLK